MEGKPLEDNRKLGKPLEDNAIVQDDAKDHIIIDKCYLLNTLLVSEVWTEPVEGFEQKEIRVFNDAEIVIIKSKLFNLIDKL